LRGTRAEAEVRALIEEAAFPKGEGFGTKLHNIFRKSGVTLPDIKRDQSPSEPAIFE
jgi:hypothetical protein